MSVIDMPSSDEPSAFRPAEEVLGDQGTTLFESLVDALVDQAGIASKHRQAAAQSALLQFALGAVRDADRFRGRPLRGSLGWNRT